MENVGGNRRGNLGFEQKHMAKEIIDDHSRTLQEYLLLPGYIRLDTSLHDVDLSADLVIPRQRKIQLSIPILSAAMQSVTGSTMAVAIARLGGSGVIYCSQPIEDEARMVSEVKNFKAGFVYPEVLSPTDTIEHIMVKMKPTGYSKFPVTEDGKPDGKLVGLLTDNDFDPETHLGLQVY